MYYTELGYDNYDDFLAGDEWEEIKSILYHSGIAYRCCNCWKNSKLLVHKRTYYELRPQYFSYLAKHNKKLLWKILSYQCERCNSLIHFYDRKKKEKVPLDYLFLSMQERKIHWKPSVVTSRYFRMTKALLHFFLVFRVKKRRVK